jgi:imidazolonepropionase
MTNDSTRGDTLGIIEQAAVAIRKGRVVWVGADNEIPRQLEDLPRLDCGGRVAVPGFVDAFSQLAGAGNMQKTADGTATNGATTEWAGRLLAGGATCVMVSVRTRGNPNDDKERLAAANMLNQELPLKIVPSWEVGPDAGISVYDSEGRAVLREIAHYMSALSIKVGKEGFSPAETRKLCSTMGNLRKRLRLHGGPDIPSDSVRSLRPLAVQDMNQLDKWTLQELRTSGSSVVLQPTFSRGGRLPIQDLMNLGITVALGTGCLPGEQSVTSMPFLVWIAAESAEVPIETALWCATQGSARALGEGARGSVRRGSIGDLVILDIGEFSELANHPDIPMVWELVREGDLTAVGQSG